MLYKGGEYADRNPSFVGCAEHALGIRGWLESQGHQYVVTDDKDGPNCGKRAVRARAHVTITTEQQAVCRVVLTRCRAGNPRAELEKHIADAHVLITTPFHPAYVTADRIARAKNLELLLTAGIGSDHVDLAAAAAAGLTVAEVTGSNTVSVAEDQLMRVLVLTRNFLPGHRQAVGGGWDVAAVAHRAYDLEGKTVGTAGAGRIGRLLLQRLKPFNCRLLYHDRLRIDPALEAEIGAQFEADLDAMLPKCDVVVINMPLTEKTRW